MLNLQGEELKLDEELMQIYAHPRSYDEGLGLERAGKSFIVVSQDGSGDCSDLREAYSQLNKNGGKIFIKDGTYILKSTLPMWKDNVSIEGSGISTIIQGTNKNPLISISGANIKISNCTIQDVSGSASAGTRVLDISGSTLIKIDKCYFSGFQSNIILRGQSTECVISGNKFNSNGAYGLKVSKSSRNVIENNFVNAELPENIIYLSDQSDQNVISKNVLEGNDLILNAIFINDGDKNIISENQISHMYENGVYIGAGNDSNTIVGNFFHGNVTNFTDAGTNTQIGHNTTT